MELSEQIKEAKSNIKRLEFYFQELESRMTKFCKELGKTIHETKKSIEALEAPKPSEEEKPEPSSVTVLDDGDRYSAYEEDDAWDRGQGE